MCGTVWVPAEATRWYREAATLYTAQGMFRKSAVVSHCTPPCAWRDTGTPATHRPQPTTHRPPPPTTDTPLFARTCAEGTPAPRGLKTWEPPRVLACLPVAGQIVTTIADILVEDGGKEEAADHFEEAAGYFASDVCFAPRALRP